MTKDRFPIYSSINSNVICQSFVEYFYNSVNYGSAGNNYWASVSTKCWNGGDENGKKIENIFAWMK